MFILFVCIDTRTKRLYINLSRTPDLFLTLVTAPRGGHYLSNPESENGGSERLSHLPSVSQQMSTDGLNPGLRLWVLSVPCKLSPGQPPTRAQAGALLGVSAPLPGVRGCAEGALTPEADAEAAHVPGPILGPGHPPRVPILSAPPWGLWPIATQT